jgi:transposase-like protein
MAEQAFDQLQVSSLYCPFCRQARPVRLKLLLCLPQGDKYAYYCQECGAELAVKMEKIKP